jgi:iron complex transport system substrate-binding protein
MSRLILAAIFLGLALSGCNNSAKQRADDQISDTIKIVSLNGTLTEVLSGLGLEQNIVGVDVTSTYPASINSKPKLGHNRNIAAEGVLALQPDVVLGLKKDFNPTLAQQFKSAGTRLILFDQEYSPAGTRALINALSDSLKVSKSKSDSLIKQLDADLEIVIRNADPKPKVLFIYARGSGTMMVAGEGTNVEDIIELSGGQNAVTGFKDFKPLTAESLVKANPDVILLFDSGLQSLGGIDGFLKVQGVEQTNAGKNKRIVEMDGQFLTGFGPRLGKAVAELSQKIKK